MHMLGRGIPKENVREIFDRVSFVVFNYDRCVEYFLFHALQKLYGIQEREAREIVADLNIIHPYGMVDSEVEFGTGDADYLSLAAKIKTYTEQIGNADLVAQLGEEVVRAASIVFLGFAYHSQNMRILMPEITITPRKMVSQNMRILLPEITTAPRKMVYGTAYGMSDSDVDVVSHHIASFTTPALNSKQRTKNIRLENKLTCAGLFDYYAKSLTGGD